MPLAFRPCSHVLAASAPSALIMRVTIGVKSVSLGAMPSLPFHAALARSFTDVGSCEDGTAVVLCANAALRAETPTQSPSAELSEAGTALRVPAATLASRPFSSSVVSAGGFSAKKTSAGEALPSVRTWFASSASSPERTLTVTPDLASKSFTRACTVCSCWPL